METGGASVHEVLRPQLQLDYLTFSYLHRILSLAGFIQYFPTTLCSSSSSILSFSILVTLTLVILHVLVDSRSQKKNGQRLLLEIQIIPCY